MIRFVIPKSPLHLPEFAVPPSFSSHEVAGGNGRERYFARLAEEGLERRYTTVTRAGKDRLDREISAIVTSGFVDYFLILADIVDWTRNHGNPAGPGRGTSAGSLVCYVLGITDVDPLRFGLSFERFFDPESKSPPDIDIDFCHDGRDGIIQYVAGKYGTDRVGTIASFAALGFNQAFRMASRDASLPEHVAEMDASAMMVDTARRLEKVKYPHGTHAAGIVISDVPLRGIVPVRLDPGTGLEVIQFSFDRLTLCGLVKFDFLGMNALSEIRDTVSVVKSVVPGFRESDMDVDDADTLAFFARGGTGVFPFESKGMRGILRDCRPDSLEDLIALYSMYRPGIIAFIPEYIARKHGRRAVEYPHPALESILEPTYGLFLYQEQVMSALRILSGCSLDDAACVRRVMAKKDLPGIEAARFTFMEGAKAAGFREAESTRLFELLVTASGMAFNKSHAASYTLIAWRSAWLKVHIVDTRVPSSVPVRS